MNNTKAQESRSVMRRGRSCAFVASICGLLVVALVVSACSGSDDEPPTTTTQPPPTVPEDTPDPQGVAGSEEAPPPEWIVQIGTPESDALLGVAGRDDEIVSTGYTEGSLGAAPAGGRDVLVAVVGTDGKLRTTQQAGTGADDSAFGVSSFEGATVACGFTQGDLGATNAGSADGWCAPVGTDGTPGPFHQQGGTEWDRLYGVAAVDETVGYAGGYTLGLFPGASDTTAGALGEGDAILWRIGPDGTPSWVRQFGTEATDWGQGVAATADGDGIIVGYTQGDMDGPSNGGTDGFIARYDPDGLPRWTRQFGTSGADWPKGVATGGEAARGTESFIIVGSTDGALAPALGGELTDPLDAPRADGAEPAPSNAGETDAMVVSVDGAGKRRWAAQLGTEAADDAIGVAVDGETVLVAGTTGGALATDGSPSAGAKDGFLAALDLESGALRWIAQFGSPGVEDIYGMTITEDGLAVVSGQTTGKLGDRPNAGGADAFLIAFPLPLSGGAAASAL